MKARRLPSLHPKRALAIGMLALSMAGAVADKPATLPPPDKDGWIKLWRGNNATDFFIAYNGKQPVASSKTPFPNSVFNKSGDTIKVNPAVGGQVYFNHSFSHYRIRYQMHYPGTIGNSGMLYHVQQYDSTTPIGGFPPAIESQGDPTQGMAGAWPIGDVWVNVKVRSVNGGLLWDPNGKDTVYGGKDWNSRLIMGKDGWAKPDYAPLAAATGWVTQEVDVYGSDSVVHLVNDTVRMKYRMPRISHGGTPDNVSKLMESGLIGWQSEGSVVWYREIQIMPLPGDSLYTSTTGLFNARNTIGKPSARKTLFMKDGVLRVLDGSADGNDAGRRFDFGGRYRP